MTDEQSIDLPHDPTHRPTPCDTHDEMAHSRIHLAHRHLSFIAAPQLQAERFSEISYSMRVIDGEIDVDD